MGTPALCSLRCRLESISPDKGPSRFSKAFCDSPKHFTYKAKSWIHEKKKKKKGEATEYYIT